MADSSNGKKLIEIDVSSDIVCPWCFVGKTNLDKAIEQSKDSFDFKVILSLSLSLRTPAFIWKMWIKYLVHLIISFKLWYDRYVGTHISWIHLRQKKVWRSLTSSARDLERHNLTKCNLVWARFVFYPLKRLISFLQMYRIWTAQIFNLFFLCKNWQIFRGLGYDYDTAGLTYVYFYFLLKIYTFN